MDLKGEWWKCMLAGGSCEHGREIRGLQKRQERIFCYLSYRQLLKVCSLFSIVIPKTN